MRKVLVTDEDAGYRKRTKKSRKSVSPKIFSGTATGEPRALPRRCSNGMLQLKTKGGRFLSLSQKSKIFDSSLIRGSLRVRCEAGGAEVDGKVFGTGNPSPTGKPGVRRCGGRSMSAPTRGREIERVFRRMGQIWEIVLRQSLRQPVRLTPPFTQGRLGALPRQREPLGAGVDGEVTTPQSALLTAPLTRGSEPSAASGRKSEVSEWQRSADEEGA